MSPIVPDRTILGEGGSPTRRWEIETGGMSFAGATLATDDRSKPLLSSAAAQAATDSTFTTEWKTDDGTWVTLEAAAIIAARDALFAFVQSCFAREQAIDASIDAAPDEASLAAPGGGYPGFLEQR